MLESAVRHRLPWLALAAFSLSVYLPYVLFGGLVCDDWAVAAQAQRHPGFLASSAAWYPLFSNRPLAPVLLAAAANLFGRWAPGYILLNLALWHVAVLLVAAVFRRHFGPRFVVAFVAMALAPSICSTVIFSPAMQLLGTSSMALWAASLFLLDRGLRRGGAWDLAAGCAAIGCGLLVYEVFLPLLAINVLYPWACGATGQDRAADRRGDCPLFRPQGAGRAEQRARRKRGLSPSGAQWLTYLVRYVAPPGAMVLLATALQKWILPTFMPVHSRWANFDVGRGLIALGQWAFTLLVQWPVLLADSPAHLGRAALLVTLVTAAGALGIAWASCTRDPSRPAEVADRRVCRRLMLSVLGALLAGSMLFVLSGNAAVVFGYDNRVLSSTWLALALLLAMAAGAGAAATPFAVGDDRFSRKPKACAGQGTWWPRVLPRLRLAARRGLAIGVGLVILLNTASFIVQRDNYLASAALQERVLRRLVAMADRQHVPPGSVVLGQVPAALDENYNDECVFTRPWDFGSAAYLASGGRFCDGAPFSPRLVRGRRIVVDRQGVHVDGLWHAGVKRLWYFEFDPRTGQAALLPVRDVAHLDRLVREAGKSDVNLAPMSAAATVTERATQWAKRLLPSADR